MADYSLACTTDGSPCTVDVCVGGACAHEPVASGDLCTAEGFDGNACTDDVCDAEGSCQHVPRPDGSVCGGFTTCTSLACRSGTCVQQTMSCGTCERCIDPQGCVGQPVGSCVGATVRSELDVRVGENAPSLHWEFASATNPGSLPPGFGDPLATSAFELCVYRRLPPFGLVAGTRVPPGGMCGSQPCWSSKGDGFVFLDKRNAAETGMTGLRLRRSATGRTRIRARGKGSDLGLPAALDGSDLVVQLYLRGAGAPSACWEGEPTRVIKNSAERFRGVE